MSKKDLVYLLSIARISFLNLGEKLNLFKKLDSVNDLALMSIEDIRSLTGRDLKKVSWNGSDNLEQAEIEVKIIEAKRIGCLLYTESGYPALLRETPNAPFMLFYRGNPECLLRKTVSVVGTRHMTFEGKMAAFEFAKEASRSGYTVVSGLAKGIDGAAHRGSIEAFYERGSGKDSDCGKTCAVLPCGIDTVTPFGHARLAEEILKTGGCLLSEYVPRTGAEKWRFVQRNRIIAGLSPQTLVVEAPNGSGSLITAQYALDYNRDLIFHEAALSESAGKVREMLLSRLKMDYSAGNVSRSKLENSIEKYLLDGAPVINGFKDFLEFLSEPPGKRARKPEQLELFENI